MWIISLRKKIIFGDGGPGGGVDAPRASQSTPRAPPAVWGSPAQPRGHSVPLATAVLVSGSGSGLMHCLHARVSGDVFFFMILVIFGLDPVFTGRSLAAFLGPESLHSAVLVSGRGAIPRLQRGSPDRRGRAGSALRGSGGVYPAPGPPSQK